MNDVDLRQLRYFVAVAEERNFTRAAARLAMTQPALSRAIRSLEDLVGAALFLREHRGVELTPAGRVLLDGARGLDELARAAVARAARAGRTGARLRVTARGCEIGVLDHLVHSYNARYPRELPVRGIVADWREQADELRGGSADVGLLRRPFDDRGLDSDLLWTERRVALLSSAHRLAGRHVVDRTELAGEVIAIWPGTTAAETAHWTGTDLAHHDWLPGPEVRDVAQLTGNVRLGQTIGFAPLSLIGDHLPAGVVAVATTGLSDSELHVVWTTATISPDVARFVRHATEHAAELLVSA